MLSGVFPIINLAPANSIPPSFHVYQVEGVATAWLPYPELFKARSPDFFSTICADVIVNVVSLPLETPATVTGTVTLLAPESEIVKV